MAATRTARRDWRGPAADRLAAPLDIAAHEQVDLQRFHDHIAGIVPAASARGNPSIVGLPGPACRAIVCSDGAGASAHTLPGAA
jgi:hypothetical protein